MRNFLFVYFAASLTHLPDSKLGNSRKLSIDKLSSSSKLSSSRSKSLPNVSIYNVAASLVLRVGRVLVNGLWKKNYHIDLGPSFHLVAILSILGENNLLFSFQLNFFFSTHIIMRTKMEMYSWWLRSTSGIFCNSLWYNEDEKADRIK